MNSAFTMRISLAHINTPFRRIVSLDERATIIWVVEAVAKNCNCQMPTWREVVDLYPKRGNIENYIKEAKYDIAVGHLLLQ